MTASENNQIPEQETAAPQLSGFASRPGPRAKASADTETPEEKTTPDTDTNRDTDEKSDLGKDFDNTEFMRLLCMLYGISAIPTPVVPLLRGFELDSSKEKPVNSDGTIYALVDGAKLEITKDSILTDEPLTPALAYKMAAAASLNPAYKTLSLSGSLEDRVMLFMAAQHFGMEIEESSIPEIPADKLPGLAAKFYEFEQSANLGKSVAEEYLDAKYRNKQDWDKESAPPQKKNTHQQPGPAPAGAPLAA